MNVTVYDHWTHSAQQPPAYCCDNPRPAAVESFSPGVWVRCLNCKQSIVRVG